MAKCDTYLSKCIQVDCANPQYSGVAPEALIFNKDQISYTISHNKIAAITANTYVPEGETTPVAYCGGYTVQQMGNKPFDGSQTEFVEGTYGNKFNHTIVLAVPDNGPEISENIIDKFANGRFVVILTNDYVHGGTNASDNKYQVYGAQKGLRASSIVREVWGDNDSYWIVTFVEENATSSAIFFFDTDASTTETAYENIPKCSC